MDTVEIRFIENKKRMNARSRKGVHFSFQRLNGFLLC